jgi:hypothetical protein
MMLARPAAALVRQVPRAVNKVRPCWLTCIIAKIIKFSVTARMRQSPSPWFPLDSISGFGTNTSWKEGENDMFGTSGER